MGLLTEIRQNPDVWAKVFTSEETLLDPSQLESLFSVVWSEQGSNRINAERRIVAYFRDLLQDIEGEPMNKSSFKYPRAFEYDTHL